MDDGVRSGLISLQQLREVPLVERFITEALAVHPGLAQMPTRRLLAETIRRMLSAQVYDLIDTTQAALQRLQPASAQEARLHRGLVGFGEDMRSASAELKRFLFAHLYRHAQVMETTALARRIVADLFAIYLSCPAEMPEEFAQAADIPRAVADYIAGMTDRYASREHQRLTGERLFG